MHKSNTVVFVRHGESEWNAANIFTGWTDVGLTKKGVAEAHSAGKILRERGYAFDIAFTSVLKRSIITLWIILEELDLAWIPVHNSWRLNEKHYGDLQGKNKDQTAEKHGEEQVMQWRRSFDVPPPPVSREDPRFPGHDPRYALLDPRDLPTTESLKDTANRVVPFWSDTIVAAVKQGKRVLVSAHGNSLRALFKHLQNIPTADIVGLDVPTGIPMVLELDNSQQVVRSFFEGDPQDVKQRIAFIRNQGRSRLTEMEDVQT